MYATCQGEDGSLKTIDFYISREYNYLLGTTHTDTNGNFSFTYKLVRRGLDWTFNGAYLFGIDLTKLIIEEDSIEYIIPNQKSMENLNLHLGDSINLDIYLDFINKPLLSTDTIYYSLEPPHYYEENTFDFKTSGPIPNHGVIKHFNSKWKTVEVDEYGIPMLNVHWGIKRSDKNFSNHFITRSTKTSCIIKNDSITITLE